MGQRQLKEVCILRCCSLFTLYSGMVVELRGQGRGVKCNYGVVVPGLFANDTALVN